ncbi:hypothetical protein SAMN04487968_10156 [Nocardioides terrae]|uniref:Protein ImuA n=1 Tax=Nocardioides terrae TaxID=574651 RepID=A0A1I1DC56_9ACTN|nr:hypothetical protein [Nocardioides terrae]SFB70668.1 hypothetical protein SAMN04487968_10156 [Nocardioides terrae]
MASPTLLNPAERAEQSDKRAQIAGLRERISRLQGRPGEAARPLDTHPALAGIVQLRAGGTYAVAPEHGGAGLALAMLAGPSAVGGWGAVVGMPDFGVEAAAGLGVRLDRTVLVPDPGSLWLETVAALVDVVTVVVVRAPGRVTEAQASKLAARLRTREAALVSLGAWPRADVRLAVETPRWAGAGRGEGHLRARQVTVAVQRGTAPPRRTELWFPDGELRLRHAEAPVVDVRDVG